MAKQNLVPCPLQECYFTSKFMPQNEPVTEAAVPSVSLSSLAPLTVFKERGHIFQM